MPDNLFSPGSSNVAAAMLSGGPDSAVAILHKDHSMTYGEFRNAVGRVASLLLSLGCRKGERIGLLSENCVFQMIAYLGVIRAGLVAVPLPPELSIETLRRIFSDADINNVFVSNRFLAKAFTWAAAGQLKIITEKDLDAFQEPPGLSFPEINSGRDLAALMFTSGSTGEPKGVMITHRNIDCNSRDIISYMGLTAADRVMVVLPLHYCFGASLLHTHLFVGGSLVLSNDFKLFPEATLQELQHTACTGLAGVPSTYQTLLRKTRFGKTSFPSLRWFQQAGGKLPNAFIQEMVAAFPNARFFVMYGQTEATARLSFLPPERLADKIGSIGRGLPSTKLHVLRPDGSPVAPGSEETGEIVAIGENVASGYWNDPEETCRFFQNGQLHTGDIARMDGEGFIFIVDRERDIIKSGGNRVSSKEVEEVIAQLPQVVEVAVYGTSDDLLGEAVQAFVVVTPGSRLTTQDVRAHCRRKLPSFKVPQKVQFIDHMPHNSSGKIVKRHLKEVLSPNNAERSTFVAPLANG